jgi:hypothetical protein
MLGISNCLFAKLKEIKNRAISGTIDYSITALCLEPHSLSSVDLLIESIDLRRAKLTWKTSSIDQFAMMSLTRTLIGLRYISLFHLKIARSRPCSNNQKFVDSLMHLRGLGRLREYYHIRLLPSDPRERNAYSATLVYASVVPPLGTLLMFPFMSTSSRPRRLSLYLIKHVSHQAFV